MRNRSLMKNAGDKTKSLVFILLTFIFTWTFWLPVVLYSQEIINLPLPAVWLIVGAFGPTISAFFLTYKMHGKESAVLFLKRGFDFRINKTWYIPIFLLMPVLLASAVIIDMIAGGVIPELELLSQPWLILPMFVILFFIGGSFNEEFGWRGYLLDKLQNKWSALTASLIIGVIWALWHLPMFFVDVEGFGQKYIPIWLYFISTIPLSIIFTWIYNNTNRSIFAVLLFHTMANLSFSLFPVITAEAGADYNAYAYYTLLITVVSIVVVFVWGPEKLRRGKQDQ